VLAGDCIQKYAPCKPRESSPAAPSRLHKGAEELPSALAGSDLLRMPLYAEKEFPPGGLNGFNSSVLSPRGDAQPGPDLRGVYGPVVRGWRGVVSPV